MIAAICRENAEMQRAACEVTMADRFLALLPSATNIPTASIGGLHGVRFNWIIAVLHIKFVMHASMLSMEAGS